MRPKSQPRRGDRARRLCSPARSGPNGNRLRRGGRSDSRTTTSNRSPKLPSNAMPRVRLRQPPRPARAAGPRCRHRSMHRPTAARSGRDLQASRAPTSWAPMLRPARMRGLQAGRSALGKDVETILSPRLPRWVLGLAGDRPGWDSEARRNRRAVFRRGNWQRFQAASALDPARRRGKLPDWGPRSRTSRLAATRSPGSLREVEPEGRALCPGSRLARVQPLPESLAPRRSHRGHQARS